MANRLILPLPLRLLNPEKREAVMRRTAPGVRATQRSMAMETDVWAVTERAFYFGGILLCVWSPGKAGGRYKVYRGLTLLCMSHRLWMVIDRATPERTEGKNGHILLATNTNNQTRDTRCTAARRVIP